MDQCLVLFWANDSKCRVVMLCPIVTKSSTPGKGVLVLVSETVFSTNLFLLLPRFGSFSVEIFERCHL